MWRVFAPDGGGRGGTSKPSRLYEASYSTRLSRRIPAGSSTRWVTVLRFGHVVDTPRQARPIQTTTPSHKIASDRPSISTIARSPRLNRKRLLYIRSSVCSKRKAPRRYWHGARSGSTAPMRKPAHVLAGPCKHAGRDGALIEIERALAMSPNLAVAHWQRGVTLIFPGRPKEGLDALETCLRLDPGRVMDLVSRYGRVFAVFSVLLLLGLAVAYHIR
jgi:hypothetical protein